MKRKVFDMNQCKRQDLLVTRGGEKVMYIGKIDKKESAGIEKHLFAHRVACLDECGYIVTTDTRTDEGWYFASCTSGFDIVGFWKE